MVFFFKFEYIPKGYTKNLKKNAPHFEVGF